MNRPACSLDLQNCGMFQYTFFKLSLINVTKIRPVSAANSTPANRPG
jgi:hypothetical protein